MTATVPTTTDLQAKMPPTNITDKTVCVNVSFGFLGNTRKVPKSQISERGGILEDASAPVEVAADRDFIRVSKTLLDSEELRTLHQYDSQVKGQLKAMCLPSLFRGGIYLVKIEAVEKVETLLTEAQTKREELIEKFIEAYLKCKKEAETRLKDLFNEADYPSVSKVRAKFSLEWQYLTFSTPGKLKEISQAFFEKEQKKAEAKWQQATEEITVLLRSGMKDLVDHLVDKLTPGEDGKPKRLHHSAVDNVKEFLANFAIKDVTDDAALAALVKDAANLLSGVDIKSLKKDEAAKSNLATGFTKIKEQLSLLVEEAGSRKINLNEE